MEQDVFSCSSILKFRRVSLLNKWETGFVDLVLVVGVIRIRERIN